MKNWKTVFRDVLTLELFATVLALAFYILKFGEWTYMLPGAIAGYGWAMTFDYFVGKEK